MNNILFVASECVPFAKTGGLADVVGVLPKYLEYFGCTCKIVIPRYYNIDRTKLEKLIAPLGVPMGIIGELWCGVYKTYLKNSQVEIYFIDYEEYFGRSSLYDDTNSEAFLDNDNRFIFLSKASLQLCKMIDFKPDIVHCNDWHTATIPAMLKTIYKDDEHFLNTKSVLSIHNMQYQGIFYSGVMDVLGIGWNRFWDFEYHGMVNFMKGGIYNADKISTVSQGYRNELFTEEFSYGLEGSIKDREKDVIGIINGVDYSEWNPSSDVFIPAQYSIQNMKGKDICKKELQKRFNLPQIDVPVFGVVSRLVNQKGVDILAEAIYKILELDLQFVLLGNGEPWTHFFFGDIMAKYPEKFACFIGYDNALSHLIEAGSDFFVMPSRFEPCGLNQMYSLAYGTPPIVRATGGLDDTIENFNEFHKTGNGFKFYDLNAKSLFDTIGWAVYTYYNNKDGMKKIIENGMSKRFTWEDSAKKYIEMYESIK